MTTGTLQNIIVCVPTTGTVSVAPCSTIGGVKQKPVMQIAYVIDTSNADLFDAAVQPLDPVDVAVVWSAGFSIVLFCFITSRAMGTVLNLIRKG